MSRFVAVDLFCGGGGASEGIRRALGVDVQLAVNHDPAAITMHRANHPKTKHIQRSVWKAQSWKVLPGKRPRVDLLWLSPDCTHHSRARGGKPRKKNIRDLAWVALQWARDVRPRVIGLENVPEFQSWGPLDANDKPIKAKRGETFKDFVAQLRLAGYAVEWRVLKACDYGAPTTRERLFLVARCDGQPIAWPAPTHGPERSTPWRTAAECIDWDLPCPSIFLTPEEVKAQGLRCKRPLAENTMRRIAAGVKKFVIEAEKPFLLNLTHGGRLEPLTEPMRTVTAANRGEKALVTPTITRIGHTSSDSGKNRRADQPLSTVTTKAEHLLVSPSLIQMGYGERKGQSPRVLDLHSPLGTVVATGNKFAVAAAFLAKHNGGTTGQPLAEPCHAVTGRDTKAVVSTFLTKYYGTGCGQLPGEPLHTIPTKGRFGLVAAFMTKFYGTSTGQPLTQPLTTITSQGQHHGLVTVNIGGETYAIADIGMRMLQPRELARAQGFTDDYTLTGTKTQQVHKIGNSVPPDVVAAIVAAQFPKRAMRRAS